VALRTDGTVTAWGAGLTNAGAYPEFGQSIVPATLSNVTGIACGWAHSMIFTGNGAPFITQPPTSQTGYTGRRIGFRATASGEVPLAYQWQFNGTNVPGATNQLLVLETPFAGSVGDYRAVVTNRWGAAISGAAKLTLVGQPPFLLAQPVSQTCYLGGPARLQVMADGSGPLAYQWRLNGQDIPGATNAEFVSEHLKLNQMGDYSVVVSSGYGAISSAKAKLIILQVVAWGLNRAQEYLNEGQADVPPGLNGVVRVAGGAYHSLALTADGTVVAWG